MRLVSILVKREGGDFEIQHFQIDFFSEFPQKIFCEMYYFLEEGAG
jgi:hypothetical protein